MTALGLVIGLSLLLALARWWAARDRWIMHSELVAQMKALGIGTRKG